MLVFCVEDYDVDIIFEGVESGDEVIGGRGYW